MNTNDRQRGNAAIITVVVLLVVVAVGYLILGRSKNEPQATATPEATLESSSPSPTASASVSPTPSVSPSPTSSSKTTIKTFNVSGGEYYFSPSTIQVNKGDTVKIVFTNKEGLHDLVIDAFNIRTPRIQAGSSATIQFVASKTGSFEYYCSVGNHRALGMKGTLTVK